jgi:hypothetical protein
MNTSGRVGSLGVPRSGANEREDSGQFVAVGGTEYSLAEREQFGLRQNATLAALLRRLLEVEIRGASRAEEDERGILLAQLAAIALPGAPREALEVLEPRELLEICFLFLSRAAGRGVIARASTHGLTPTRNPTTSLPTLIAIVLRDTTPFSTMREMGLLDFLEDPDEDDSDV